LPPISGGATLIDHGWEGEMNALKITIAGTAAVGLAVALLSTIATLLVALGHLPSETLWEHFATLVLVLPLLFIAAAGLPVAAIRSRRWRIAGAVAWTLLLLRWTQQVAAWSGLVLVRVRGVSLDLGAVRSLLELGAAAIFLATLIEVVIGLGVWPAIAAMPRRLRRLAHLHRHVGRPHLPSPRPL
jgi:hypothetical protein